MPFNAEKMKFWITLCFCVLGFQLMAQDYRPAELIGLQSFVQQIPYPAQARSAGISGRVLVRVWVNQDSTVTLDRIIKSPDTTLSLAVIGQLGSLRGIPALRNQVYEKEGVTFPVQFSLQEAQIPFIQQMNALPWQTLPSGLSFAWINQSGKDPLQKNKMAGLHYTGFLENGQVFDTSKKGKAKPFLVLVGKTNLIAGWEEALTFLAKGDRVWLRIPPQLGYGQQDVEGIPPGSVLYFDLEVLSEP